MEKPNYPSYEELRNGIGNDSEVAEAFLNLDFESKVENYDQENHNKQLEKYVNDQYEEITSITRNAKLDYKYNVISNSPFAYMEDGELVHTILIVCTKEKLGEQNATGDLINKLLKSIIEDENPTEDTLLFSIKNINVEKMDDIVVGFINYGLQFSFEDFTNLIAGFGVISIAKNESRKFKGNMDKLVPLTNTYVDMMGKVLYGIYLAWDLLNTEKEKLQAINNKILETKSYHDSQE